MVISDHHKNLEEDYSEFQRNIQLAEDSLKKSISADFSAEQ
jgi:hypothetical protein